MRRKTEELLCAAAAATRERLAELTAGRSLTTRAALVQIRRHFYDPGYQVTDVKRKLGVSSWFLTTFRIELGITPWRLIQECRMETAATLLRRTSLPVDEISFLVGYEATVSFQRLCKRWCGLPPSQLRCWLRRTKDRSAALPADVLSWRFWQRQERRELAAEELRAVVDALEALYGRAS